jgi:fluoride exporter
LGDGVRPEPPPFAVREQAADDSYRSPGGSHFVSRFRRLNSGGRVERFLLVGVGGFIGSTLRYTLGGLILRLKSGSLFPWETLAVNVIGCLAIGVLAGLSESRGLFAGTTRVFLFVGVLGGFTTFSSFGYETFELLRDGQW